MKKRAQLGIDGNCGFALLGEDLQEGEAEFVEIDYDMKEHHGRTVLRSTAERMAAKAAFEKLKTRLDKPDLSFWFGPSHPFGD